MKLLIAVLVLALGILPGCTNTQNTARYNGLLLPEPFSVVDPSDEMVDEAVASFLKDTQAPGFSLYDVSRVDLNSDGRRDALVLFKNPYGYWCDMHGCTMLVLKAHDDHFTLVNAIQPIRNPLYVSDIKTNGWKNLIVHVSGRWKETKDVALQFDGKGYPAIPPGLPPYLRLASHQDTRIFYD